MPDGSIHRGRLEQLRELILLGNPIRELEYKNNRSATYKRYVCITSALWWHTEDVPVMSRGASRR